MNELPNGWAAARLVDVIADDGIFVDGDWVETKDQHPDGEVRLTQLADVGDGRWRNRSERFMTADAARRLDCTQLQTDDILVARMPDPLGRACLFPGDPRPCVTVVDVAVIRPGPTSVRADWLMWAINSPRVRSSIDEQKAGTTRKRVSRKNLGEVEIPIPPLLEQERIVVAIEEAFSKLGAGEAGLRTVRQLLKRMREATVAAAFDGLSFDTKCVAVCSQIVDCPHSTAKFQTAGRPCIDTTCISPGKILRERLRFVSDETWLERTRRLVPAEGDVIFSREGTGTIGIAVALGAGLDPCLGQRVMLLRPASTMLPRFLEQALMSAQVRAQYRSKITGSASPHLNVGEIKMLKVPDPPATTQHRVVETIDRGLALIEACERAVTAGLARSAALRRSVLKAAFEGRLVPQDPSDVPAAALLERIRAERAAGDYSAGGRRRRTVEAL